MRKKTSAKGSTRRTKKAAKIRDLPARAGKSDKTAAVKGGVSRLMEEEGIFYLR